LEEKEEVRKMTQAELVHQRQEILLLGELLLKYKEKARQPQSVPEKQGMLFLQAYEEQISGSTLSLLAPNKAPKNCFL
jgi:hypothetical protein